MVDVHLKWVEASNESKHSEVVFVPVDQVWIVDVVTGDVRVSNARLFRNLCLAVNYFDSFCVNTLDRFADPEA